MVTTPSRTRGVGQLLSPSHVAEVNRSRVIEAFRDHGPMTPDELESLAGVPRSAVRSVLLPLTSSGFVTDDGGRLWFGTRAGLSAGVVLGEGRYEAALTNARGEILEHATGEFDAEDMSGHAVGVAAREGLERVLSADPDGLLGIGIAVPGACDPRTGYVVSCGQVPALRGNRFTRMLASTFGQDVLIDNDSRAMALGEKWFGAGRGLRSFASVQTGSGLGVGLVIDGSLYRGPSGTAGELGHTAVVPRGERCACGLQGCWETIATLRWLRAQAEHLRLPKAARLDAARLLGLAETNRDAQRLLEEYAEHLAIGLANLTHVLGITRFVLHGDVIGGGERLRSLIDAATRRRVLPGLRDEIGISLSELDQRAAILGTAGLVLSTTFDLRT